MCGYCPSPGIFTEQGLGEESGWPGLRLPGPGYAAAEQFIEDRQAPGAAIGEETRIRFFHEVLDDYLEGRR
jgi:hypothetical protein